MAGAVPAASSLCSQGFPSALPTSRTAAKDVPKFNLRCLYLDLLQFFLFLAEHRNQLLKQTSFPFTRKTPLIQTLIPLQENSGKQPCPLGQPLVQLQMRFSYRKDFNCLLRWQTARPCTLRPRACRTVHRTSDAVKAGILTAHKVGLGFTKTNSPGRHAVTLHLRVKVFWWF